MLRNENWATGEMKNRVKRKDNNMWPSIYNVAFIDVITGVLGDLSCVWRLEVFLMFADDRMQLIRRFEH